MYLCERLLTIKLSCLTLTKNLSYLSRSGAKHTDTRKLLTDPDAVQINVTFTYSGILPIKIIFYWPLTTLCLLSAYNMSLSTMRAKRENPPPALPAGFNSRLWPKYFGYAPPEVVGKSVHEQLIELNLERHEKERKGKYKHEYTHADWMKEVYDKPGSKYCHTCSAFPTMVKSHMTAVFHNHRSSLTLRVDYPTSLKEAKGMYHCFTCERVEHGVMQGARLPVILSSSTMADWAANAKKLGMWAGTPFHIDHVSIGGATVRELAHGLLSEYRYHPAPLDVVLFGGVNNLLQGQTLEMIKIELKDAKFAIEAANKENSVAIASIIYPPMLSKLPCDRAEKWPKDFVDRTADIYELNRYIFLLNKKGNMPRYTILAPKCQTFGLKIIRTGTFSGIMGRVNAHNLDAWREKNVHEKLHLREEQKLKIGKSVVNYFSYIYGLKENVYSTRQERREADEVEELEAERINELALAQGLDARRAINMRKEKRLVEELTTEQWAQAEERQWRLWDIMEEEFLEDKIEVDEDGNILHHAVQRNEEQEYLTCYQGFSEFCQGCYECDGLNLEVVMEQGRRFFKYK